MLKQRILTVAVLLPLFLAALFLLPNLYWGVLTSAVLGLAAHEWGRLAGFLGPGRWALPRTAGGERTCRPGGRAQPVAAGLHLLGAWPASLWPRRSGLAGNRARMALLPLAGARPGPAGLDRRPGAAAVLACTRVAAAHARPPARRHGSGLDRRHRGLFHRPGLWTPQAGPTDQPGQDLGGRGRRSRRSHAVLERDRMGAAGSRPALCGGAGAGGGADRGRHPRRSVRVLAQAASPGSRTAAPSCRGTAGCWTGSTR